MSAAIDERIAWELVRAVIPGSVAGASSVRVGLDADPDAWIEVGAGGRGRRRAT